jgi:hypothetical protein
LEGLSISLSSKYLKYIYYDSSHHPYYSSTYQLRAYHQLAKLNLSTRLYNHQLFEL